jgi:Holliday junction DNA helicase RuvA
MYDYMKGTVVEIDPLKVVLEVNHIGYKILIPFSAYAEIKQNSTITLYTAWVVREDSQTLYGFLSKKDRSFFDLLLTVSGIGPKTALSLLGHIDIDNLHMAIHQANIRVLSSIPGIGKKTAERLVIELKDKLKLFEKEGVKNSLSSSPASPSSDAIQALIHLGYAPLAAQKAVKAVLEKNNIEDVGLLISHALRKV